MPFIIKIRIFLWAFLVAAVGWLLYMAVVPGGKITYSYTPDNPSYFIRKMTPAERVKITDDGRQLIIGDPVYFSLFTSRRFDKAKLIVKYKTEGEAPIIEAGVLADKKIWRHNLKPIANKIINDLSLEWDVMRENGLLLFQREKKFGRLDNFLNNLPSREEIALYNYDLRFGYFLKDYKKSNKEFILNRPLRGAHQFYTYIKDEDFDFRFVFFDLNKNKDSDPVELNLYQAGEFVASRYLNDDGVSADNGITSEDRELGLKMTNLPEGVYKIELKANDDIVIKKIITSQQKLAFINKIWLADANGKNISLYTDSKAISAQTINPARLQTIKIGDGELPISETYKQFNINVVMELSPGHPELNSLVEIKLEKDDIVLSGNGVFSFSKESLINPEFRKVDVSFDAEREGINYVLAKYNPPVEEGDWLSAAAEFDLSGAYRENGKYGFIISIPGLRAENGRQNGIEIREIRVELEGNNLKKFLMSKL